MDQRMLNYVQFLVLIIGRLKGKFWSSVLDNETPFTFFVHFSGDKQTGQQDDKYFFD